MIGHVHDAFSPLLSRSPQHRRDEGFSKTRPASLVGIVAKRKVDDRMPVLCPSVSHIRSP